MYRTDRRRILFAAVFTTLALPALWVANDRRAGDPSVGAVGVPAPVADPAQPDSTYQPEDPVFLDDSSAAAAAADVAGAAPVVQLQTPTSGAANEVTTTASFKRLGDIGSCGTTLVVAGTTLTIENIDNGRIVTCRAVLGVTVPAGSTVVLDTALMAQITDLSEAPIPVRVSW